MVRIFFLSSSSVAVEVLCRWEMIFTCKASVVVDVLMVFTCKASAFFKSLGGVASCE